LNIFARASPCSAAAYWRDKVKSFYCTAMECDGITIHTSTLFILNAIQDEIHRIILQNYIIFTWIKIF